MAPKPATLDCDAVLSELGWLKRLARGLGADANLADDLTQATFLTALEHPPETARPVRGWLRAVLQNLLNESKRRKLRREAREARAARPEADASVAAIVERAAVQKQVVDAVMTLEEPYRTTVLLRFFEDLPPRKIAARTGTPVATVKTRLARGLEQLRSRLDREHGGDRRAWLLCLLAPLPKAALATSTLGVVIVQAKLKLAAGLAAVLLIGVAGWFAFDRFADRPQRTATPGAESVDEAAMPRTAAASPAETATPIIRPRAYVEPAEAGTTSGAARPDSTPATARADTAPSAAARLRGRVIDTRSAPVAGVHVVFRIERGKDVPREPVAATAQLAATSGPDGVFEIETPRARGSFVAEGPGHATVLVGNFDVQAPAIEPLIVVAPLRKLAGRVVDGGHQPVVAVEVGMQLPPNFRANFDRVLDYSQDARQSLRTDAEGRFVFDSAPDLEGAKIVARLEGWDERIEEMPPASVSDIEIVMQRTTPVNDKVTGQVVDHGGVGVPGARVSTRDHTTLADEAGRFTIKFDGWKPPVTVMAVKDGYLPAVAEVTGEAPVVLRLDGSPLTIAGKVVDQDGKALAGINVWLADPTLFASGDNGIEFVESLLGNAKAQLWGPVNTTDDGRFVLRGLMARDYTIKAMDPKTLAQEDAGAVKAGSTDVVITFGGAEFYENVGGTVVSLGGVPLANVKVQPVRNVFTYRTYEGGSMTQHADTEGTVTDEAGRFKLARVPKKGVYIHFEGANTLPRDLGRDASIEEEAKGQALDRLRIEVPVRCHLQVDLGARADFADKITILNSAGQPVPIDVFFGNGRMTSDQAAIADGRTSVLAVPENTATVIFFKAEKEVDRKRIRVVPGQVTTIRP